jgi:GNAT superfamily N-acetyltransferase
VEILTFPDDTLPPELDARVLAVLRAEYPEYFTERTQRSLNDPDTNPTLMVLVEGEEVMSYLAIPSKIILHAGEAYRASGLSNVITNPSYRGRGYGSRIVTAAREFIAASGADIGVFTCDTPLVDFYVRCGWSMIAGTWLVGGTREKPFPSNLFDKRTLMGFFTERALAHRADFEDVPIHLELREGDLW